MRDYTSVTLPKVLIVKIDEITGYFGFTSRADFVKTAIRRELERLNSIEGTRHER